MTMSSQAVGARGEVRNFALARLVRPALGLIMPVGIAGAWEISVRLGLSVWTMPSPTVTAVPARSSAVPPVIVVLVAPAASSAPACSVTPLLRVKVVTPLSTRPASTPLAGVFAVSVVLVVSRKISPATAVAGLVT